MSDSELSRPGAGNAPDDGEETVGLVERLSSERRTIDKSLVDLEKKIGDQNIKIKTLEGKISGKRRELEIQIERVRLEKEALERQRERKNDELKNVNRKLNEVWEKKMNGESIKNAKVLTDITDSEYNTHDITYNTSKTNEF